MSKYDKSHKFWVALYFLLFYLRSLLISPLKFINFTTPKKTEQISKASDFCEPWQNLLGIKINKKKELFFSMFCLDKVFIFRPQFWVKPHFRSSRNIVDFSVKLIWSFYTQNAIKIQNVCNNAICYAYRLIWCRQNRY